VLYPCAFTLYLLWKCIGSGGITPCISNLGTTSRWSASQPRHYLPGTHRIGRWMNHKTGLDTEKGTPAAGDSTPVWASYPVPSLITVWKWISKGVGMWVTSMWHGIGTNSCLLKTWYRTFRFCKSGTVLIDWVASGTGLHSNELVCRLTCIYLCLFGDEHLSQNVQIDAEYLPTLPKSFHSLFITKYGTRWQSKTKSNTNMVC